MNMIPLPPLQKPAFAYQVLRYSANLIRDEWVNIGVLVFGPQNGELQLRLVESPEEYARIRRLHPQVDEEAIRQLRDHLEDRFLSFLQSEREAAGSVAPGESLQRMLDKWNATLSNAIQLAPQKGTYAADLATETDRLYGEQVAPPRPENRVGAPGSRSSMRQYCSQVWRQARLWERIEKSVRVQEFTFPGDPMRFDYGYRHNGTRGFVQLLSVTRSPKDCKELAYTADHIARRAPFASEFVAVTDVALQQQNERHRFVNDTLREAGVEAVPMEGFAVWVAKLKPMIQ
jgi:hypothetical protein